MPSDLKSAGLPGPPRVVASSMLSLPQPLEPHNPFLVGGISVVYLVVHRKPWAAVYFLGTGPGARAVRGAHSGVCLQQVLRRLAEASLRCSL